MRRRSAVIIWALAMAMLCAWPAMAQQQVGSVAGRVTDAEGGVLPGATVELTGPGIATLVSTADERGNYRFPRVPPGVYTVSAQLEGFQTVQTTEVTVTVGRESPLDFELQSEFAEEILVTGERTQIDLGSNAVAPTISREQLELVPRGRDFSAVVNQVAGVEQEDFLGGISVDGASGAENVYILDGVNVTNPDSGLQGQTMRADFVEELQVSTAGYNAEYGGAVGGVINVITKSGSNEFHGTAGVDFESRNWQGDERSTPRQDASEAVCGAGNFSDDFLCNFPRDTGDQIEPAFSLGGPIVRDKVYFFVAAQNSVDEIDRRPVGSPQTFSAEETRETYTANIKGNVGSQFLYRVTGNMSDREFDGVLPNRDGSTDPTADLGIVTELPNESYSAYADYVPTNNFYLTGQIGIWERDEEDKNLSATQQIVFTGSSPADAGLPENDPRNRNAGFLSVPSFTKTFEDKWERQQASLAANLFVRGAGDHALKGGVQYMEQENNVLVSENGNLYRFIWNDSDRFGAGVQGDTGSLEVRRFETIGEGISGEALGVFLQDQWAVLPNLTLNLGVRAEQEEIPNFPLNVEAGFGENAIEWDFDDKLAPRFGFAWDILSDQRFKLFGSFGTYYDIMKLSLARGSFGGDRWVSFLYPFDTFDWQGVDANCVTSVNDVSFNPCPSLGTPVPLQLRNPSDPETAIDPDLKPFESEEIQLGLEHQLTPNIVLGARYVNKEVQEAIEDIGFIVFENGVRTEEFIIGNPGKGIVGGEVPGVGPQPEAIREYEAITLSFERRLVDDWSLRASFTNASLEGNYSGLGSSDEFGRSDPNVERLFDAIWNGYDQNGQLLTGPLATERPNQAEVQGIYRTRWGTVVGVEQKWFEGTPISEEISFGGVPFFPNGRGNLGRTPSITETNLEISHPFKIGGYELELAATVLNLFDEDEIVRFDNQPYQTDVCAVLDCGEDIPGFFFAVIPGVDVNAIMEQAVANGDAVRNPLFLRPDGLDRNDTLRQALAFQPPREVRLSLTFRF